MTNFDEVWVRDIVEFSNFFVLCSTAQIGLGNFTQCIAGNNFVRKAFSRYFDVCLNVAGCLATNGFNFVPKSVFLALGFNGSPNFENTIGFFNFALCCLECSTQIEYLLVFCLN